MPKTVRRILLVITGSIAAYKTLELIRLLDKRGIATQAIMTRAACEFITPLSVATISGRPVYTDLFSLKDESEMGHIRLSREADLIVVAPASADSMGKLAHGLADDLASAVLLASDKPVIMVPAMNVQMWQHDAVQRNVATLKRDGVLFVGPEAGDLACKEEGYGRMSSPEMIVDVITQRLA